MANVYLVGDIVMASPRAMSLVIVLTKKAFEELPFTTASSGMSARPPEDSRV
jgi:hypothetical protein